MRSREEIVEDKKHLAYLHSTGTLKDLTVDPNMVGKEDSELILEVLLDIRDLLTEQSKKQRVEKPKVCKTCGGKGEVTEYNDVMLADDAPKILPFKVSCPDCIPNPQS